MSRVLVAAFRQSVDTVKQDKELTNLALNEMDKKRILETFIENDEALGQLLDFISAKKGGTTDTNTPSMSIVDNKGNRNWQTRTIDNKKSKLAATKELRLKIETPMKVPISMTNQTVKNKVRSDHYDQATSELSRDSQELGSSYRMQARKSGLLNP